MVEARPGQKEKNEPEEGYGVPVDNYGAPADNYGVPVDSYGVPTPVDNYSAPCVPSYAAPEPKKDKKGLFGFIDKLFKKEKKEPADPCLTVPQDSYGLPVDTYGAPEEAYGAPVMKPFTYMG